MKMNRLDKINNQPKRIYIMQHKLTKNQEEKINGFLNVGYKVYFSCNELKLTVLIRDKKGYFETFFWHKGIKNPYKSGDYADQETLDYYVNTEKNNKQRNLDYLKEAEKKAQESFKIGDILYTSWGYDQTNVDFYKILDRKGKTLTLTQMAEKINYDAELMSGTKEPQEIHSGVTFKRKISKYGYVKITDCASAFPWDGKPKSYSSYA